jgi:ribosome biogenesis GTPase A
MCANFSCLQLLRTAVDWIQRDRSASELSIMLLVGLPNSGKSSLINALKMSAKAAGAQAGSQGSQRSCQSEFSLLQVQLCHI